MADKNLKARIVNKNGTSAEWEKATSFIPKKGELKDNFCNFDRPRIQLFNEERVYDSLVDAGLFPEFSNSFLVIAKREEE